MNTELELTGLDGSNPLAFLAALGTLRILTLAWPDKNVRLSWRSSNGWRPVLSAETDLSDSEKMMGVLHARLEKDGKQSVFSRWDNLNKIPPDEYRSYAHEAVQHASQDDRVWVDFVAAFGNEASLAEDVIQDTAFRTMSGAGHQDFLKFMRLLVELTTPKHLEEALLGPWRYQDDKPSMRWDPMDDRRYALRWSDPSGDPIRTVRGANRLAMEALPLFPTMPTSSQLETTGFRGRKSRDTFLTWPIWKPFTSLEVVRSVLALSELQTDVPNREALSKLGIVEVYRAQRITVGKFRNFTLGKPV